MRSFPTISSQVTDTANRKRYLFFFFYSFVFFFSSLIIISPVLWFYRGDWNLSLGDVYILNSWLRQSTEGWWVYMVVWCNGDIIFAVILQNIFSKIKKEYWSVSLLVWIFSFQSAKAENRQETLYSHFLQYYFSR